VKINSTRRIFDLIIGVAFVLVSTVIIFNGADETSYATCSTLPTDRGTVTATVNVPTSGTYQVWSRIKTPSSVDNTFLMQVDGTYCNVNVGGSSIPANTWTWVNYKNGSTSQKVTMNLTAGSHTMTLAGNADNVMVDRIILTQSTTCTPTGTGDNCTDSTPPSVSITSPSDGSSISSTTTVAASATDNIAVTKVEFAVDGSVKATDSSSPYRYSFDPSTVSAGSHTLTATAYDASGNSTKSSAVAITVNAPPQTYLEADINQDGKVNLTDLSILSTNYNRSGAAISPVRADMNSDGKVNLTDLSILSSQYGR